MEYKEAKMAGDGKKLRVAVLFGGASPEHEVSIISATQFIYAMDRLKYDVYPVYISERGEWFTGPGMGDRAYYARMALNPGVLESATRIALLPMGRERGLTVLPTPGKRKPKQAFIPIDVFVPVFHGGTGENGGIQGLLELAGVPYVGPGVMASSVGMNKWLCKQVAQANGVPVLPAQVVRRDEARADLPGAVDKVLATEGLGAYPLFVKPCNLGSSIGVSSCTDRQSLGEALVNVFKFDAEAIVEPMVRKLIEINVAVMEGTPPRPSVVERPNPEAEGGFLTYEDKYMRGDKLSDDADGQDGMASLSRVIDPADVAPDVKARAQQYAVDVFTAIRAGGIARIDFIIDGATGALYFNEINTIPGSLAFYLWNESTPSRLYTEVVDELIEKALARFGETKALRSSVGFKALLKK